MTEGRLYVPLVRVLALFLAVSAAAQQNPLEPPEYTVASGDTLEVTVLGNQDASRVATITPGGSVTLPLVGEVAVSGLTIAEVRQRISELLEKDHLVNPQVEVRIKDYGSRYALAVGELRIPGRHPLRPDTRLIDLLREAGGFTALASGEVVITRAEGKFPDGNSTLRLKLSRTNTTPADRAVLVIPLRTGDIAVASPLAYVIVEGEVASPGRFLIEEKLTISEAIAIAGGITRYGSSSLKLRRSDGSGGTQVLPVNLKAIRKGIKTDLPLQTDDVITVPRRLF